MNICGGGGCGGGGGGGGSSSNSSSSSSNFVCNRATLRENRYSCHHVKLSELRDNSTYGSGIILLNIPAIAKFLVLSLRRSSRQ